MISLRDLQLSESNIVSRIHHAHRLKHALSDSYIETSRRPLFSRSQGMSVCEAQPPDYLKYMRHPEFLSSISISTY